jgi:hypothetical protein
VYCSVNLVLSCLTFLLIDVVPDASRPDRAWFFGANGGWGLVNGMTGKVDKQGTLADPIKLISCNREAFLIFAENPSKRLLGFNYAFEALFEVAVEHLQGDIECVALHPSRTDLIAVADPCALEIIKISPDNWAPQRTQFPIDGIESLQWGPEEIDPISRETIWKLVTLGHEKRVIKLFTIK